MGQAHTHTRAREVSHRPERAGAEKAAKERETTSRLHHRSRPPSLLARHAARAQRETQEETHIPSTVSDAFISKERELMMIRKV
jgi:hypothetical protein